MQFQQKTMLLCEYKHFLRHYKRVKNFYSKYREGFLLLETYKTGTRRAIWRSGDRAS
jgi:hypothetical protein